MTTEKKTLEVGQGFYKKKSKHQKKKEEG